MAAANEPLGVYTERDARAIKVKVLGRTSRNPNMDGGPVDTVPLGDVVWVKLTQTGGSAGSNDPLAACTFTYKAEHQGLTVGTGLSPAWGRYAPLGKHTAATEGLGIFKADGTFSLLCCNEKLFAVTGC